MKIKVKKIPLIVIAGPTASGKTSLAVEVAKAIGGEVVSADSVQIYKYLDIGSAKPTAEEMQGIPHYMVGEIEPSEDFSVADFTAMAHKYIADIYSRGKIPVLAGGTGLYINSVVNDVDFEDEQVDENLRKELWALADEKGAEFMLEMLREVDPVSAERIHANNTVRVIRAIEFYKTTGIPISQHQELTKQKPSRYNPCIIAIEHDRERLYERINLRVDIMMNNGLLDEVRSLIAMGYRKSLNSMKGIGYKEVMDYLDGKMTYEELCELIKQQSRRYAKRQITWFKKDPRTVWVKYSDRLVEDTLAIIYDFLKKFDDEKLQ